MKKLTYTITINKPIEFVFTKFMDNSVYPDWAKAWGAGMTYIGDWIKGGHISFVDATGGTKGLIEDIQPNSAILMKHVAMVDSENVEKELSDDMMRKWIGSREDYFFKKYGEDKTVVEVIMELDEVFQPMMDGAWPKALQYFKVICEK